MEEKETRSTYSQCSNGSQTLINLCEKNFTLFKCHRSIDHSTDVFFDFLLCRERLVITKHSVVVIKKIVVNHESRPIKSSLVCVQTLN